MDYLSKLELREQMCSTGGNSTLSDLQIIVARRGDVADQIQHAFIATQMKLYAGVNMFPVMYFITENILL